MAYREALFADETPYAAMEAMTTRLVPVFAVALDLPPDYFDPMFEHCGARLDPVLEQFASGPAIAQRFANRKL